MFYLKINVFLEKVCREIKYKPVRTPISEELEEHLLEIKEEKMQEGLAEEQAEEQATQAMGEPEKIGKRLNKIHKPKLDWQLLGLVMILILYGIFNIIGKTNIYAKDIKESIFYIIAGIGLGAILYFYDYRKMQRFSNIIYLLATLLIILAFTPTFGVIHGGIQYIAIMKVMFNPTMLSVPLYIIAFSGFLINVREKKEKEITIFHKNILVTIDGTLKIIVTSIISLVLILIIPSIINAVILGIVYFITGMIYILKTKGKKKVLPALGGSMLIGTIFLFMMISLNKLPVQRMIYSIKPEADPQNLGYVGMLQKEVLKNSKMIGQANTEIISKGENIITGESNYTFIYLMGKLGILAVSILAIAVILIAIRLIINANLIKNMYGKMAIIGLGTLYILQSVFNILMNLNLGIQTNVNLPFVCEGGVFFIINCISVAFILSVYRRKDIDLEIKKCEEN